MTRRFLLGLLLAASIPAAEASLIQTPAAIRLTLEPVVLSRIALPSVPSAALPASAVGLSLPGVAIPNVPALAGAAAPAQHPGAFAWLKQRGAQAEAMERLPVAEAKSIGNSAFDFSLRAGAAGALEGEDSSFQRSAEGAAQHHRGTAPPSNSNLPPYLSVANAADASWLAEVVELAQDSREARRVLRDVAKFAASRARPVTVVVDTIRNSGEFNYDWDVVLLKSSHKNQPPSGAVATLIHELQHVLQRAQGLPSDAFEMELEAYVVDMKVSDELGMPPDPGSFDEKALKKFKKGLPEFIAWLKKRYPDNIPLIGSSLEDYEALLLEQKAGTGRRIAIVEKHLAKKRAVYDRMLAEGAPQEALRNYRADAVAPVEDRLRQQKRLLAWIERDLELLRAPESRARYAAYARRVLRKARAYQKKSSAAAA